MVRLGHYIWDMTSAMTLERITKTVRSDRSTWAGQARQDREDGMSRHDNKNQTMGAGELWATAMEQDSWDRTGGTG